MAGSGVGRSTSQKCTSNSYRMNESEEKRKKKWPQGQILRMWTERDENPRAKGEKCNLGMESKVTN